MCVSVWGDTEGLPQWLACLVSTTNKYKSSRSSLVSTDICGSLDNSLPMHQVPKYFYSNYCTVNSSVSFSVYVVWWTRTSMTSGTQPLLSCWSCSAMSQMVWSSWLTNTWRYVYHTLSHMQYVNTIIPLTYTNIQESMGNFYFAPYFVLQVTSKIPC